MAKPKKKQPVKYPLVKVKLPQPMGFDEAMRRIVRVKPPKDNQPPTVQ